MKVIGITGGVGSGKSLVTDIMKNIYGAMILNMDQIAHELMQKDKVSYRLIVDHFGNEILNEDETIDRSKLGQIVYNDKRELLILNSFTHPYVIDYVKQIINGERKNEDNTFPFICVETALPDKASLTTFCDKIWYVYAHEDMRRGWLRTSRNYDDQKIDNIFQSQIKEEEYRKISTDILFNNSSKDVMIEQIEKLISKTD